jgi:anti-sigma B factor antagonist
MEWKTAPKDDDGFSLVTVAGDFDLYSAPAFGREMLSSIADGASRLRLDLTGVDYLDSTGVGALIRILQAAKKTGCELRFTGIRGSPRKVLKMCSVLTLMREDPRP